jgi:hypothetical protein
MRVAIVELPMMLGTARHKWRLRHVQFMQVYPPCIHPCTVTAVDLHTKICCSKFTNTRVTSQTLEQLHKH